MVSRKDLIMVFLATFCLTSTLFMIRPTGSNPGLGEYDPWVDLNDDGTIDIYDAITLANAFETSGTPINKTGLLLELQSKIDSLNASLTELMNQVKNVYEVEITGFDPIGTHAVLVDIAKNGIPSGYSTPSKFILIGDNTFTVPLNDPYNHTFTHWNTGSTNTTITVSSPGVYTAYFETPLEWFTGLVGYWKFDEGNGTVASDSSGNNNSGTLVNDPLWVEGVYGKGLNLNGSNSIVIPDAQSLDLQAFSLEAWIYMTERPYQHGDLGSAIINKIEGPSGGRGYKLQFDGPSSTDDNLVIAIGDGSVQRFLLHYNTLNDLTLGTWHQVVGTYDGTSAGLYIDGMPKVFTTPGVTMVNDDLPLVLGAEYKNGGNILMFNGLIDNVMIYNRALSSDEVIAHYLRPPP